MSALTPQELRDYCLRHGDNALILGQRLGEWCGHAPVLEEDIALTNVALDLIGQARLWLTRAGEAEGEGRDEDTLAMTRDVLEFRNALLVEQPNGDFAHTIARQFLFDAWAVPFYDALRASTDETIRGIAEKAVKEALYHRKHSSEWIIRLGDGTEESRARIETALAALWGFVDELFEVDALDAKAVAAGIGVDPSALRPAWEAHVDAVLEEATLARPDVTWRVSGGRKGQHSEHLGYILAEMQFLRRAYPDAKAW